jgi:hypothetical protein
MLINVEDLGEPEHTCEACGQTEIRYVHEIEHPEFRTLLVGCVCCEHLTGDYVNPRRHEAELRKRAARRARWLKRKWKTSAKGNPWLKADGRLIAVFASRYAEGYHYAVDGQVSRRTFPTERAAMLASYDGVEYLNRRRDF